MNFVGGCVKFLAEVQKGRAEAQKGYVSIRFKREGTCRHAD